MDPEKGRIDRLSDTLNSRTRYKEPLDKRNAMRESEFPDVAEKWESPPLDELLKRERIPTKASPFIKKVFIFALLFFVMTVLVAAFIFNGGVNFISSRNVDISVLGPTSISAGQVLDLGLSISNTNNASLDVANLTIQYPSGSRNPDNTAESLSYTKDSLGVVKAGSESVRNVRVVLLGTAGEIKEIKFSVEYKVEGSNATFYKDKIYEITIGDAPVTLTVESPSSVTSGNEFTTNVSVTLNSTEILKNVILKAEYPYGYSVTGATPKSTADENVWALGDLSPGEKKEISIKGQLVGQNQEERTFRFYVGVSDSSSVNPNLKIIIVSILNTIAIDRPSVGLDIAFNGDNSMTYLAPAARDVDVTIRFQNNLPDKLLNPRLEVSLSGAALNKSSIAAGNNGVYDSGSTRVFWNLTNSLGNSELTPGGSGQVNFRFASVPAADIKSNANEIKMNVSISGLPVGSVGQGSITTNEVRTVKISSQIGFLSKALRSLGPFANSGPIPPKVGEETTYAIIFDIVNTQGDMSGAKVTAKLGPSVTWLGAPSTGEESITYDSLQNTLTWDVGDLRADTGFSSAPRELAFQVSLKPTANQVGTAPILVNSIVFSGRDNITGNTITLNGAPLTTKLTSDPAFIQGDDIVVK